MGKVCVALGFEGERARESWSIYEKQIQKSSQSPFRKPAALFDMSTEEKILFLSVNFV